MAGVATLVVVWEAVVRVWRPAEYLLPAPADVLVTIQRESALLVADGWTTGYEVILGFLAAVLVGFGAALVLHVWPQLGSVVWPTVLFAQITPQVAIAPFLLMWFGLGLVPKVILAFLIGFFPVLVNSYLGLRSLDAETAELALSMRANRVDLFVKFELPAALPHVLSGAKTSMTYCVVGAIVAEFIGSNGGLGHRILVGQGTLESTLLVASLIVLAAMGFSFYFVITLLERLLIPWHISQRRVAAQISSTQLDV
jgi:NitT/TauT family transport system permease protein